MKILIPLVGQNKLTADTDYIKSLYEINRKMIFQYVHEFLSVIENAEFIYVVKKEDVITYHIDKVINLINPQAKVVIADGETRGAACSCLLAVEHIYNSDELVIANCDQLFLDNPNEIIKNFRKNNYDGGIVVFEDIHPRWSYVKLNKDNLVIEAAEKRPISKNATAGVYYFKHGFEFVNAVEEMIFKDANVNGNYYVCPAYNELVLQQKRIGIFKIEKSSYFSFKEQKGIDEYAKFLNKGK